MPHQMPHHLRSHGGHARPVRRRRSRSHPTLRNALAGLLCLVTLGGVPTGDGKHPGSPGANLKTSNLQATNPQTRSAASTALAALFDPRPMMGLDVRANLRGAPLGAAFAPTASLAPSLAPPVATLAAVEPAANPAATPATGAEIVRQAEVASQAQRPREIRVLRQAQIVPLPMARPVDLIAAPVPQRLALRRAPRRVPEAAPAPTAETPSFFEELFAARKESGPALAYAALESPGLDRSRGRLFPGPDAGAGTAIYDISARTVRLPSGEVLEAHSGLGASMDHPDFVHLRMRGSTPPGTYDLTEREALFHGVRAIRLNPVGGSAAIHGRDGLLAHTYMLGPSGASNGCVSFRNYDRFLQAFLRGEVRRLVVVAGRGDGPARFAASR